MLRFPAPFRSPRDLSSYRSIGLVLICGLIVTLMVSSAVAQTQIRVSPGFRVAPEGDPRVTLPKVTLWAGEGDAGTFIPPRVPIRRLTGPNTKAAGASSTFDVDYTGFSSEAEVAFQAAVDVWSQLLVSEVTIRVTAVWTNLGSSGILGQAGPDDWKYNFSGSVPNTWYPVALAEAIAGSAFNSSSLYDIEVKPNSSRSDWYYGIDGATPSGKIDLMSRGSRTSSDTGLVLSDQCVVDDAVYVAGQNLVECDGVAGHGCWGAGTVWPFIFDRFAIDDDDTPLLNVSSFPLNSTTLGNVLTSGDVYFSGTEANSENGDSPPELYAPGSWQGGSSYSHLDESLFPPGNANSLMTPSLSGNEAIHDPGQITLGIFADIGWEIAGAIFSDDFEDGDTDNWSSTVPPP